MNVQYDKLMETAMDHLNTQARLVKPIKPNNSRNGGSTIKVMIVGDFGVTDCNM